MLSLPVSFCRKRILQQLPQLRTGIGEIGKNRGLSFVEISSTFSRLALALYGCCEEHPTAMVWLERILLALQKEEREG